MQNAGSSVVCHLVVKLGMYLHLQPKMNGAYLRTNYALVLSEATSCRKMCCKESVSDLKFSPLECRAGNGKVSRTNRA